MGGIFRERQGAFQEVDYTFVSFSDQNRVSAVPSAPVFAPVLQYDFNYRQVHNSAPVLLQEFIDVQERLSGVSPPQLRFQSGSELPSISGGTATFRAHGRNQYHDQSIVLLSFRNINKFKLNSLLGI